MELLLLDDAAFCPGPTPTLSGRGEDEADWLLSDLRRQRGLGAACWARDKTLDRMRAGTCVDIYGLERDLGSIDEEEQFRYSDIVLDSPGETLLPTWFSDRGVEDSWLAKY